MLDGAPADRINPNLTSGIDLTEAYTLPENRGIAFMGDTKVGPFEIPKALAQSWLPVQNPNGRPNSDVLRPWANGREITHRPQGLWIIDFPPGMSEEEEAQYEAPFEYIKERVRPFRREARSGDRTGVAWWIHQRPRPEMRAVLGYLRKYGATARVSSHRIFVFLEGAVLPDARLVAIGREDDYFFGVLHSKVHELWSLATSSRHGIGNDPTYNVTTCFETFPFPWPPGKEAVDDPRVQAIAAAAEDLVEKRDRWLNPESVSEADLKKRTLTNLYNERPTWLDLAHHKLDDAVLDAYAWPHDLPDEAILERLLALNLERAGARKERP